MSANLHPLFASIVQAFAPAPAAARPVEHLTSVERVDDPEGWGYEIRCGCGWSAWRAGEGKADDAGRDHESGHEVV